MGKDVIKAAVDTCFFPLYEVEHGITTITNMIADDKKLPVEKWLEMMGKTKHLLKYPDILGAFQKEVDRRWTRLKAMHESPVL